MDTISVSQKLNIVVVSNGITPYGTHFLKRIAKELKNINLQTVYSYEYSMGNWGITPPQEINAKVLGKGEMAVDQKGTTAVLKELSRGFKLVKEIKTANPDAVMILGYGNISHFVVIEWCNFAKIPCIMWADSNILCDNNTVIKTLMKKLVVSRAVSKCTALLPCGSLGSQYFQRYGAQPDQIFFVPNEPDYSLIENVTQSQLSQIEQEFQFSPNRRRLLYSGRLASVKRVDLLLAAFTEIAELRANWDLVIAGSGPLEQDLKSRIPAKLLSRIFWTGFIANQEKMAAFYRLSDVLVLPSDYEPWALVINEAACAGLAIVCSDIVGAAADLVEDGINGRMFKAGDLSLLTDALFDVTDELTLQHRKTKSKEILNRWRQIADPVEGFHRALKFSVKCGTKNRLAI